MGREIKRVPLDFDWPMGKIWPPFMANICTKEIGYCIGKDKTDEEKCAACRHAGRLAGRLWNQWCDCPQWEIEPPSGEGYQLWETTSEGSPMSPVFKTPEELAQWLFDNKASSFGHNTASYEHWLNFIKGPGWAPTAIVSNGIIMSGVEAVTEVTDTQKAARDEIEGRERMDAEDVQKEIKGGQNV